MNKTQAAMLDILKSLRDECGVVGVKAEFEAEGSRLDEMIWLSEVINRADLFLNMKIGGCEAIRDLDQCIEIGAQSIVAPMIETPFAMSKFVGAAKKVFGDRVDEINWTINAETKDCHENLDSIIDTGKGFLNSITIGRVDLSGSMGLSRAVINDDVVSKEVYDIAKRTHDAGLKCGFGGGISFDAIPFIKSMKGLGEYFETRKVVFTYTDDEKILKKGILGAMKFETLYLENKCEFYSRISNEDKARLKMMHERVEKAEGLV